MKRMVKAALPAVAGALALAALSSVSMPARAQIPFIGQLQFFPYNFEPRGWSFCNGQILPISSNTALFSLLGTTFGGDGRVTFALPDMRGRIPVHPGHGPGLTERRWGEKGGVEAVTLTINRIPEHFHSLNASSSVGTSPSPADAVPARNGRDQTYSNGTPEVSMHAESILAGGGGQPHENMPPWLALNCNIATIGIFPSRP